MKDELIVAIAKDCGLCTRVADAGYRCDAFWFDESLFDFAEAVADAERVELASAWEQAHGFDKYGVAKWLRTNS